MKRILLNAFSVLIMSFSFTTLFAQALPECDPLSGNTVTIGAGGPVTVNLNAGCNFVVPNMITAHGWTATPGVGWIWDDPLVQVPPPGLLVDLVPADTCHPSIVQVTIIGIFSNDNGTPLDPTDDIICQVSETDQFNVQDIIVPVFNAPAGFLVYTQPGSCTADTNAIKALFTAAQVADNCTDDATLLSNIRIVAGSIPNPAVTCPTEPDAYLLTFILEDACGNPSDTEAVNIRVRDTIPPTITCPLNDTINSLPGVCTFTIPRELPASFDDNCDPAGAAAPGNLSWRIIAASHPAVTLGNIPVGGRVVNLTGACVGPVTATIRICAQDCFDNGLLNGANDDVSPNCCTYDVTLIDNTAPVLGPGNPCGSTFVNNVDADCAIFADNYSLLILPFIQEACNGGTEITIFQIPQPGSVLNDGIPDMLGLATGQLSLPAGCELPDLPDDFVRCGQGDGFLKNVLVSFVLVDCNGNCTLIPDCLTLELRDEEAPNAIFCPAEPVVVNLEIDPTTCQYTNVTIPTDLFNDVAVAVDNCDLDPVESNPALTFSCNDLGLNSVPISALDCNGNQSGVLISCDVLVQANPQDADWNNPGIVCMNDLPLDLCSLLGPTAAQCGYWSGDGVNPAPPDNRCNGANPAMFDPGAPGVYSVTYTVGDANCHVELTRAIHVEQNLPGDLLVINGAPVCLCPDAIIDYEAFLLNGVPQGGRWGITFTGNLSFLQPGPNLPFSHVAIYNGGCGILTLNYAIDDCNGNSVTDSTTIIIRECTSGSFDLISDACQDRGPFFINAGNSEYRGCNDNIVTYSVLSGPDGNALIGGAPVSFLLGAPQVVTVNPLVSAGVYRLQMSITDPTGICPVFNYEQVIQIYPDGANPNGIINPSPICENATFPIVLNLQSILDEAGDPLTGGGIRWWGTGTTDIGVTANFQPADTDGDGMPGPGLFTVCVDVGNVRCAERYCADIIIQNAEIGTCMVEGANLCLTPNQVISFNDFLGAGAPLGGTWTANVTPTPDLMGVLTSNGYIYNGGCGLLIITYTLEGECGPAVTCTGTLNIQERPDVDLVGDYVLCVTDPSVTIRNNGRTSVICGIAGVFTGAGVTDNGNGTTATFNPATAGEGTHYVIYTIGNPQFNCQVIDTLELIVEAASNPFFDAAGPYCIDETAVIISLLNPNASVQEGSPDGLQEVTWSSSCVGCLVPNADSTSATFNPSAAGAGYHLVCVTTGDGACMKNHCDLIQVMPALNAALVADREFICFDFDFGSGPFIYFDLNQLYLNNNTTRGGTWSVLMGPAAVRNEILVAGPGCIQLRYTVGPSFAGADGACAAMSDTINIILGEEPQTNFDMAEEICWDGVPGSVSIPTLYEGETYASGTSSRTYAWSATAQSGGPVPSFGIATDMEPIVIAQGAGVFEICLTETLSYAACGDAGATSCSRTHCEILTIHQTDIEVVPTWTPTGPFCIDDVCIDLDALVTGNTGGVFTGAGVSVEGAHPNYQFCPTAAGAGTHAITYTVNNGAGCTAVETHNITVFGQVNAGTVCDDQLVLSCATKRLGTTNTYTGSNTAGGFTVNFTLVSRYTIRNFDLESFLCPIATKGGTWSLTGQPANILFGGPAGFVSHNTLFYSDPGCYTLTYTVSAFPGADDGCVDSRTYQLLVGEEPSPGFTMPNQICWAPGVPTITYDILNNYLTSLPRHPGTQLFKREFVSNNPAVATVGLTTGIVTITGAGIVTICMNEYYINNNCTGGAFDAVCNKDYCQVITVTNTVTATNPAWGPAPGPFCVDDACIDLDALVTGTPGGIFTGHGVSVVGAHPQYQFCPTAAGPGIHVVTYTTNSPDGCSSSLSRNITVHAPVDATLNDVHLECQLSPTGIVDLSALFGPTTTGGGTFTLVSGNGIIQGTSLNYTTAGCYEVSYTVSAFAGADGACTATDNGFILISEKPDPRFDLSGDVCWDGIAGSASLPTLYNGTTEGDNATRTYAWTATLLSGNGPVPTFSSTTVQEPTVVIQGAGVFRICVTETLTYDPCGSIDDAVCSAQTCELLEVHETSVEAVPTWSQIGPFCTDDDCIDLDALVTGTSGGVFTGSGVSVDGAHPNYVFCPEDAGEGIHAVTYTVNNGAGCTGTEVHNIQVFGPVDAGQQCIAGQSVICGTYRFGTLQTYNGIINVAGSFYPVVIESYYSIGFFDLTTFLCPTATEGGTWTLSSSPTNSFRGISGYVSNNTLIFSDPGCYEITYTVSAFDDADGACADERTYLLTVGEEPVPSFNIPDQICWSPGGPAITYNILTTYLTSLPRHANTNLLQRVFSSSNTSVATVDAASGIVTIIGEGTATICMQEYFYNDNCGNAFESACAKDFCQVITVTNSVTARSPAWGPAPGPFCIDDPCIDLDALVTGDTGGVFTGEGVVANHPNYEFCPEEAGPGLHAVTYTVNSPDGCTNTLTRNIRVFDAVDATLEDVAINCQVQPSGLIPLSALFTANTTPGGTWTLLSGPASGTLNGYALNYQEAGCYEIEYTVTAFPGADGACTATDIGFIQISEMPTPHFDIQDARCWNITDPIASKRDTAFINSPSYDPSGILTRTFAVTFGPAVILNATIGAVQYNGAGDVQICMTETIAYAACGELPAGTCVDVYCTTVNVEDGTAQDAGFTWTPVQAEYCLGDVVTLTPNVTGGIFTGPGVVNSNPPGTSATLTFTACGIHPVTYTVESPNGCENALTITFYTDRTRPNFVGPREENRFDTVVNCNGTDMTQVMNAWANRFTFTDNCEFTVSRRIDDRRSSCSPNTGLYVYEITATDECGNETSVYPSFFIQDTTRPTIVAPARDTTVICGGGGNASQLIAWLNDNGGARANDACSGANITWTNDYTGAISDYCNSGRLVNFTAADQCGNVIRTSATFTIIDDVAPVWNKAPVNLRLECNTLYGTDPYEEVSNWVASVGGGVAIDSCTTTIIYTNNFDEVEWSGGCNRNTGEKLVTFTATDACGNATTANATVVIVDEYGPEITSPAKDTTVECDGEGNLTAFEAWINNHASAVAADRCSGSKVLGNLIGGGRAAFVTGPTPWGAPSYITDMDAVIGIGNWDPFDFTVNAATLFSPAYSFVYLEGSDGAANAFNAFVNTNLALIENWVAAGGRLFLNSAPNQGGNINLGFGGVQIFYANTLSPTAMQAGPHPIFNGPLLPTGANYTGNFFGHALVCPPGMTAIINGTTNSGTAPVLMESFWGGGLVLFGTMTNSALWHQPQPNANNLKKNMLHYLYTVPLAPQGYANQIEGGIMRWDTTRMRVDSICGNSRALTYMFIAVDSCGNASNATIAKFIIEDKAPPVFTQLPRDTAVDCDRQGNQDVLAAWLEVNGLALAEDVCNPNELRWEYDLIDEQDLCSNTESKTYRFTVYDICGNSAWAEADFIVQDTTSPIIDPESGEDKLTSCDQSNAGNDDELVAWLLDNGGLEATDNCADDIDWTNNFSDLNWIDGCGDTRFQNVTFTATDDCGNTSTRTLQIGTNDLIRPLFTNCPRPPLVIAAETFHCDAYVNFSPFTGTDNCSAVKITQVDKTGLKSGDRFPVGVTMLVFEARDSCDNVDTCAFKIIVNDYWDLPSITCVAGKTFTAAQDSCGLTLTAADSIAPRGVKDNCPNTLVSYTITDSIGQIIKRGFNDATGSFFPVGRDTITYCVYDQPVVLITEVTQQFGTPIAGGTVTVGRTAPIPPFITTDLIDGDYIEIGNYGSSVVDMTCLMIEIVGPAGTICDYTIPPKFPLMPQHFLAPGEVATFHVGAGIDNYAQRFFHMNCTQAAISDQRGYILKLDDRVIDVFASNGFNPVGKGTKAVVAAADWIGATDAHFCRGSYYRTHFNDNNRSTDFELAESCNRATIGTWNPTNLFTKSNNDTVSLQSIVHPPVCCKIPILVEDKQSPVCGRRDTITSGIPVNLNTPFAQGVCYATSVTINTNCVVGGVRILNMTGSTSENLGDYEVTLVSPRGTRVKLWENMCNAATSYNINFSIQDKNGNFHPTLNNAPCVPNFGNGGTFQAMESLDKFFGEQGQGTWRIEIEDNTCSATNITNVLTNWRLQVLCKNPSNLRDTTITADFRQCHKKFLWVHPFVNDNCPGGTISMTWTSRCTVARTGMLVSQVGPITKAVSGGACDSLNLPIGITKFVYTLTDKNGNTGMCMFSVTVRDINAPVVQANKDITIVADPTECGKHYYFPVEARDSCGLDTVWSNPPSGFFFPVGTTRVCVHAIDKSGNRDSSCFNVTVNPYIPNSNDLACNDQINFSLDATCTGILTADMLLEGGNYFCYNNYIIEIREWNTNALHANLFTYADVGKCFRVTIRDPRSGNSCWGMVCVEDKQKPELACPRDTVISCIASTDPIYLGFARVLNCEPRATINYYDEIVELGECKEPYITTIDRTWIIEDESGNSDTCHQFINIRRLDLNELVFPRDYDDLDLPHLECSDRIYDKDISSHIRGSGDVTGRCVDGYLMDSTVWLATNGNNRNGAPNSGVRVPHTLGWNELTSGKYAGHPSPYSVYFDAHPAFANTGACWGPNQIPMWAGTGFPTILGYDISQRGRCAISIKYDDDVYEICENSYEILRYWKIRNMCLPVIAGVNPIEHIQVIKVLDKKGPEIYYPDSISVTTDQFDCTGTWVVPAPWMEDKCSDTLSYSLRMWTGSVRKLADGTWVVFNLKRGTYRAEIVAVDGCGNQTIKNITVRVADFTPPHAVCEGTTQVNIVGRQSTGQNFTEVYANTFDDGSYDNCSSHVFFKAIRMDELRGTTNGSTQDNTAVCGGLNGDDDQSPNAPGNQIYFDDYVRFCCEDVGKTVMVVFRVFDIDPGLGPVHPTRMGGPGPGNQNPNAQLAGHFTDCMVEVEVVDKNVPTITAPPDMVVSCMFWFDINNLTDPNDPTFGRVVSDLSSRKKVVSQDIVCRKYCDRNVITGYPGFVQGGSQSNPPAPNRACDYYNQLFDTAHPDNKYELVWGFDGYALASCSNQISITVQDLRECGQGRIVRTIVGRGPNNTAVRASQTIWVVDCDPFFVDITDKCNSNGLNDIEWPDCTNQGRFIAGCGQADVSPDNPLLGRPNVLNNADDNCALISIEYTDEIYTIEPDACFKILRHWVVIDWCQYNPAISATNGRWHHLQVIKVRDQSKPVVTCTIGNCEPAAKNAQGICVGHLAISVDATDNCSPLDWLLYDYKIDAYNDGVGAHGGYDFVVSQLTKRQFAAGERPAKSDNPYADDPNNPFNASGTYPLGIHRITWYVEDGCGNIGTCSSLFEVKDCKAPTPYCLTGIITVPMPSSGCVTVWAKDLDKGSFDNCTDAADLKFYFDGDPTMTSKTICCADFEAAGANDELIVKVELWVEDAEGNKDFCKTEIIVQDNQDICKNSTNVAKITGELKTEGGAPSKNSTVELYNQSTMMKSMITQNDGQYFFLDLKMSNNYMVKPLRNDDPLNGVTTADIVKIQRHILDQEKITSVYKLIAADVNLSNSISASDISEIRRLILGNIAKFNKSNSWTFVPKDHVFVDPDAPFPYPTTKTISMLNQKEILDFVAIKMGDITGNAVANVEKTAGSRTSESLDFEFDEKEIKAGEEVRIDIKSSNFDNIAGYQFTFKFDEEALIFNKVETGSLETNEANFGLDHVTQGMFTTSWNNIDLVSKSKDDVLFTIVFKATKNAKLSNLLAIDSEITVAEAYDAQLQIKDVNLKVRTEGGLVETAMFELYQNEPNPFNSETEISFSLPEAGNAVLTMYDLTGKVIRVYELKAQKGMNAIAIKRSELSASGMVYYQLDAADHTATKRMILVD